MSQSRHRESKIILEEVISGIIRVSNTNNIYQFSTGMNQARPKLHKGSAEETGLTETRKDMWICHLGLIEKHF